MSIVRSRNGRSSCSHISIKNFTTFTGKHLCWSLFLIKLQVLKPVSLLKGDCNTGLSIPIIFRVTTLTQELLFRSNYFSRTAAFFSFFRIITFSQELFFQNSFVSGAKLLQSRHVLRI